MIDYVHTVPVSDYNRLRESAGWCGIEGGLEPGQAVYVNLMAAKGRESFYTQFGFTDRPSGTKGSGMTMWVSKPNAVQTAGAAE